MTQMYSENKAKKIIGMCTINSFIDEFPNWKKLFNYLTPRQQIILSYRFGLRRFDGTWVNLRSQNERSKVIIPSFAEIGEQLGISAAATYNCFNRGYDNLKIAKANYTLMRHSENQLRRNQHIVYSS